MKTAKKTQQFSIYIAPAAGIGWLWESTVNCLERLRPRILKRNLGSFPITPRNQAAGVPRSASERPLSNMNNKLTASQRRHLAAVKSLPCGVCGAAEPSDAHHIEQGLQYLCIPLCKDCHQGSFNGIHGQKRIWNVLKKTELSVLNDTIEKLTR